jgi:ribonuclease P protein component
VLPAPARLRARADFTAAVKHGRRGRSPLVLVHLSPGSPADPSPTDPSPTDSSPTDPSRRVDHPAPVRAGFVVSRAVGGAVVRNTVKRRLRALTAARLDRLPAGSQVVVRALPAAARASSSELGEALDRALRSATSGRRTARPMGAGR